MSTDPIEVARALNGVLDEADFRVLRDELQTAESLADLRGGTLDWIVDRAEVLTVPDFRLEWIDATTPFLQGEEFGSRDDWMRLWRDWLIVWDEYELEHRDYERFGDQVVCEVVHRGRGSGSGLEAEIRQYPLWTIRDGRAVRARMYETREEAEQAARAELKAGQG